MNIISNQRQQGKSLLGVMLAEFTGGTKRKLKPVPSQKSQRTAEQVSRLRVKAQLKRDVRSKKRNSDDAGCKFFNPCYKVGKPSQKFFDYVNHYDRMVPLTLENERWLAGFGND